MREHAPVLFRALVSSHASRVLGFVNFDLPIPYRTRQFIQSCGVDFKECLDAPADLDTARKLFERKIRYWECRPMVDDASAVVSPADARVLMGSFDSISSLFIKQKFFDYDELLGQDKQEWLATFRNGAFMIFRLTPDKYHYNHTPVAGAVKDFYEIPGGYHSCNPGAVVSLVTAYSKNKRVVTIIDTDVPKGTGVGFVAMIEVVALMVGEVEHAYSDNRYDSPRPVTPGMFLEKGLPKSLFRPGSSTVVLLFEKSRLEFADDLVKNMHRTDVQSRYSAGFERPLVETDVKVRSLVGTAANRIKDF